MRKLSYVIILAGILIMLYPQASEWYNDRQEAQLLNELEQNFQNTATIEADTNTKNTYAQVNQLLAEEPNDPAVTAEPVVAEQKEQEPEAIALIQIDKIDLKLPVLEGATKANMKHAAAHITETSPIGEVGNAAIAAHRARTKGRLFNRLNEMENGDIIKVTTNGQTYEYKVFDTLVVEPTDVSVLNRNDKDKILTLITCDPLVNPTHRLIIHAKLS
ncbi:class D sortase [Paenibacillus sp. CN-4]|uniref:class D sortase n=1 Tax=Paenibacillus nanchangensis TaxID=3348343 RepID=UPI0039795DE5